MKEWMDGGRNGGRDEWMNKFQNEYEDGWMDEFGFCICTYTRTVVYFQIESK